MAAHQTMTETWLFFFYGWKIHMYVYMAGFICISELEKKSDFKVYSLAKVRNHVFLIHLFFLFTFEWSGPFTTTDTFIIFLFFITVLRDKFRLEPKDTNVVKGGTARLICAAPKGTPSPTIFWKKNGKVLDIDKDPRYCICSTIVYILTYASS